MAAALHGVAIRALVEELQRRGPDYVGPLTDTDYRGLLDDFPGGDRELGYEIQRLTERITEGAYAVRTARGDLVAGDRFDLPTLLVFGPRESMEFIDRHGYVAMVLPGMMLFWWGRTGEDATPPAVVEAAPPDEVYTRRADAASDARGQKILDSSQVRRLTDAEMAQYGDDRPALEERAASRVTPAQLHADHLDSMRHVDVWRLVFRYDNAGPDELREMVSCSFAAAVCAGTLDEE